MPHTETTSPSASEERPPQYKINSDKTVAVATDYFWQPMSNCPRGVKVQLLGIGGVPAYGNWDGRNRFWSAWAPLPKKPTWLL